MKRLTRRQRTIAGATAVGLLVVLGILFWSQSSNNASIMNDANGVTANQTTAKVGPQTLSDPYFSFVYAGSYRVISRTAEPPSLANYVLASGTSYDKRITVALARAPLASLSAYNFRQTRTDLYSGRSLTLSNGSLASIWSKIDSSEITAFLLHDDMVATVSLSVQDSNATSGLPDEMSRLLDSFRWQ